MRSSPWPARTARTMATSTILLLCAIPCAFAGIAVRHVVRRRRFYRRNSAGVEEFPNYGALVATRAFEGLLDVTSRLCLAAAFALTCGFGLVLCGEGHDHGSQATNPAAHPSKRHITRVSAAATPAAISPANGHVGAAHDQTTATNHPTAAGTPHATHPSHPATHSQTRAPHGLGHVATHH